MSATHTHLCSPEGKYFSREKAAKYAESQGKNDDIQKLKCFNVKKSEKNTSKTLALDESSFQDSDISLLETDDSFMDTSNDESEQSFATSEEYNNGSDCILTDPEEDDVDIVLD